MEIFFFNHKQQSIVYVSFFLKYQLHHPLTSDKAYQRPWQGEEGCYVWIEEEFVLQQRYLTKYASCLFSLFATVMT